MATNKSLKDTLSAKGDKKSANVETNFIKSLINNDDIKGRFTEILKDKAPEYMSSIINLVNSDKSLIKCLPTSIVSSSMVAAALDLPMDKNLGYTWMIPYKNRATFQLGYKGYVQLALRTAKYKAINVIDVHEGELVSWNPLSEELEIDFEKKKSDAVTGYAGYFQLLNGFRKTVYWSKEKIEAYKKKFAKSDISCRNDLGVSNDFDSIAKKILIKNMLSKWGILSSDMQKAYMEDGIEASENKLVITIDTEEVN